MKHLPNHVQVERVKPHSGRNVRVWRVFIFMLAVSATGMFANAADIGYTQSTPSYSMTRSGVSAKSNGAADGLFNLSCSAQDHFNIYKTSNKNATSAIISNDEIFIATTTYTPTEKSIHSFDVSFKTICFGAQLDHLWRDPFTFKYSAQQLYNYNSNTMPASQINMSEHHTLNNPATLSNHSYSTSYSGATAYNTTLQTVINNGTLQNLNTIRVLAENYGTWTDSNITNDGTLTNHGTINVSGVYIGGVSSIINTQNGAVLSAESAMIGDNSTLNTLADFTQATTAAMISTSGAVTIGSDATLNIDMNYGTGCDKIVIISADGGIVGNFANISINGLETAPTFSLETYKLSPAVELDESAKELYVLSSSGYAWENEREKSDVIQAHGNFYITTETTLDHAFTDRVDFGGKTVYNDWDGKTLTKTGAGTLVLSGANTYTGETVIREGVLSINSDANIGGTSAVRLDGGKLAITGSTISKSIILADGKNGEVINNQETAITGDITGTGSFTKSGAGELILNGENTYTGATAIIGGALTINKAFTGSSFAVNSGAKLTANADISADSMDISGELVVASGKHITASAVTLNNNSTFSLGAYSDPATAVLAASNLTIGSNVTLNLTGEGWTRDCVIATGNTSAGRFDALRINGQAYIDNLSAADFEDGVAIVYDDAAATVNFHIGGLVWNNTQTNAAGTIRAHGNFNISEGIITVSGNLADNAALVANYAKEDAAATIGADTIGLWDGRTLTKVGSGTLILSGDNTYTGETVISDGTLSIDSDTNIGGTSAVRLNGGKLAITGNSISKNIILADGKDGGIVNNQETTITGNISGTGSLTKTGTGTLVLGGENTYTGTTRVSTGNLKISRAENLAATESVALNAATTLEIANEENTVFAKRVTGTGSLTKTGGGNLTLTGENTYTGATNITDGTLTIAGDGNISGTSGINLNNASLTLTGSALSKPINLQGLAAINNSSAATLSGVISGAGDLVKIGAGMLVLNGENTYTGSTTIQGGSLYIATAANLGSTSTINLNGGALTVDNSQDMGIAVAVTGTGSLTKTGAGTLVLGGENTYTGATIITGGTLSVTSAANLGGTSQVLLAGGNLLLANREGTAINLAVGGNGALTMDGDGVITIRGTAATSDLGIVTVNSGEAVLLDSTLRLALLKIGTLGTARIVENAHDSLHNSGLLVIEAGRTLTADGAIIDAGSTTAIKRDGLLDVIGDLTINGGTLDVINPNNGVGTTTALIQWTGSSNFATGVNPFDAIHVNGMANGAVTSADYRNQALVTSTSAKQIVYTSGGLVWNNYSGSGLPAHGYFNLSGFDDEIPDNLADNTNLGGTIDDWDGRTLTKQGSGTLTLTGHNTYTGATVIQGGALKIASEANIEGSSKVVLDNGRLEYASEYLGKNIELASGKTGYITSSAPVSELSGNISGGGNLNLTIAGTLTLAGHNTYTGSTAVDDGRLQLNTAFTSFGGIKLNSASAVLAINSAITNNGSFINTAGGMFELMPGSAFNQTGDMATGNMRLVGGRLNVAGRVTMSGDWDINLDAYKYQGQGGAAKGENAIITAGSAVYSAGRVTIRGGNPGRHYELIKSSSPIEDAALAAAIRAASGTVWKYYFDSSNPYLYMLRVNATSFPGYDGSGIADALSKIANDPAAAAKMMDILDVLNGLQGDALKRAINELDNREMGNTVLSGMTQAVTQPITTVFAALDDIDANISARIAQCRAAGASRATLGGEDTVAPTGKAQLVYQKVKKAFRKPQGNDSCSNIALKTGNVPKIVKT